MFRNKLDGNGEITRNKARLVYKGYAQEEGLNYGETFSHVVKMDGVRNLLAYAAYKGFKVYQMDVKFVFLNDILEEEVYIEKPKEFVDENNKDCYIIELLHYFHQQNLQFVLCRPLLLVFHSEKQILHPFDRL